MMKRPYILVCMTSHHHVSISVVIVFSVNRLVSMFACMGHELVDVGRILDFKILRLCSPLVPEETDLPNDMKTLLNEMT